MSQTQRNSRDHQLIHQCINPHYNSNNSGSTPVFSGQFPYDCPCVDPRFFSLKPPPALYHSNIDSHFLSHMSDPSQSSRFRALFEAALQDYQIQTGTTLVNHPLAEKLQNCNSVESVTAVLQEQARAFNEFLGDNGRITKSLKGIVSVLYTLSSSAASIGLVR